MGSLWLLGLALLILLLGGVLIVVASRRHATASPERATPGMAAMGYGVQRWERDLALWRGTLRRLHIQATQQTPPSDALQQQIAQAESRIAEAERQLAAARHTPP